TVQALQEPAGPGVRVDSSLYPGLQVPLFYDPLLSKLIVWGKDRAQAIARMRRALMEYQIVGVRTTLPFARWLMQHPRFINGNLSTDFISEEWDPQHVGATLAVAPANTTVPENAPALENTTTSAQVAALVGSLLANEHTEAEKLRRQPVIETNQTVSRWRDAGRREALR
ncbi:MAG TPA: acetyl-CoA carboxylase biotin carboxylase subunit, partial [Ktedonobacteraceae bacterium]